MSKEQIVAQEILKNIGGKENIKSMEHCATRLRLIVKDKSLINEKAIENIDGVRGQFFAAAQYQIILGTGFVNKVFATMNGEGVETGNIKEDAYSDMTLPQKISRTLGDIFVPIIPVLVATGLFMGLRGLLTNLGVEFSPTFNTLSEVLTDTAFIFLPALVAWSTMKKFGGTPVVGIVLGLMLVAPQLPNAWQVAGGADPIYISLLGISIPIVGYQGSVLPALVLGIIAAKLEKFIRKFMPDVLDLIFTPFLTLLVSMISSTGLNPFNAVITGAIVAQGAAALAVGFKTKDKKKRSLYISSAIPAFLGITEAAIFGVNLRFIKPFIFACIGGAASGMFASMMKLAGTGMGITAIPGTLLYINTGLIQYFITIAIGFAISFALTYIFFKPQE